MTETSETTSLTFTHPVLTNITGTPTNVTLKSMTKEIYTNARSVYSTRGGGTNGHLAIVMPAAAYLTRTGIAFDVPPHPGPTPIYPNQANVAQRAEVNRAYDKAMGEFKLYIKVTEELKKQIIAAVDKTFIKILDDREFGYSDVSCLDILTHLKTTYGTIESEDIEANRNSLSTEWDIDTPIEELWEKCKEVQQYSEAAGPGHAINDQTVIHLTLSVFEKTGVFDSSVETWRAKVEADRTLVTFKAHFNKANKERARKLTAKAAGYHGANAAKSLTNEKAATTANTNTSENNEGIRIGPNTWMYYCWSHGLCTNDAHTSIKCTRRKEGHKEEATADNMMGGCNLIRRPNPSDGTRYNNNN